MTTNTERQNEIRSEITRQLSITNPLAMMSVDLQVAESIGVVAARNAMKAAFGTKNAPVDSKVRVQALKVAALDLINNPAYYRLDKTGTAAPIYSKAYEAVIDWLGGKDSLSVSMAAFLIKVTAFVAATVDEEHPMGVLPQARVGNQPGELDLV